MNIMLNITSRKMIMLYRLIETLKKRPNVISKNGRLFQASETEIRTMKFDF